MCLIEQDYRLIAVPDKFDEVLAEPYIGILKDKQMNKKIKLEDTPAMLEKAQNIVRYIIKMQSMPTDQKLGRLICAAILGLILKNA